MNNDLITVIDAERERFAAVAVKSMSSDFEREKGFAAQILGASDYLTRVALGNRASLANAITNVAAIGISLNPASKLAYLVPRKNAICLDISYMGLMHIAQECGAILWGQAVIVREKDDFKIQPLGQQPLHVYSPFATDRGKITGVYCVVKTAEGDYLTHPMSIAQVNDIRDRSEAYRAYLKDNTKKCPWNTDEEEMIKKTCVKQAAKYWPRRERLDSAVNYLNTDGGEGLPLKPNTMPEDEFEAWKLKIQSTKTKELAKDEWRKAVKICEGLGDVDSAERLKAVMLGHAAALDNPAPAKEKAAA